jgi:hypothetical protein
MIFKGKLKDKVCINKILQLNINNMKMSIFNNHNHNHNNIINKISDTPYNQIHWLLKTIYITSNN